MYPHDPLRICESCAVHHCENCPDCFGFGVYGEHGAPVSASEAIDGPPPDGARACPTCGSTVAGVPVKAPAS